MRVDAYFCDGCGREIDSTVARYRLTLECQSGVHADDKTRDVAVDLCGYCAHLTRTVADGRDTANLRGGVSRGDTLALPLFRDGSGAA